MLLAFVSAVGICLSAGRAATAGREDAARKQVVLSGGCAWRTHYALFPPRLSAGAASAAGLATDEQSRTQYLVGDYQVPTKYRIVFGVAGRPFPNYVPGFSTPLPPENWAEPAFDDSGWLHAPGIEFTGMRASLVRPARGGWAHELPAPSRERMAAMRGTDPFVEEVGLICMRGQFLVKDRTRVKGLSLFLSYRGGFVAYLNGKEVARASLPAGPLTPTTAAADYPLDCFAGPGGEPPLDQWLSTDYDFDTLEPRWAARERRFGPRLIALAALRDGVNVLAVELHRSDYPAECRPSELGLCFGTVGVGELLLEAESPPENVVSATSRPDGLQVWNAEPWEVVYTTDYGNPAEPLQPIRLVGARNGAFSGQVVVGFTEPIADLRADVTPLDRAGGRGRIAADNLRVRFGRVNPTRGEYLLSWRTGSAGQRFDMLLDAPPAVVEPVAGGAPEAFLAPWAAVARQAAGLPADPRPGAVVPVWVTVQIPRDAPPGDYRGTLTIAARGAVPVNVPMALHVVDWILPDVKDFASVMFAYQSPDTLAEYYKVPLWSEAHWRLVGGSFQLLGSLGNAGLVLPLLAHTQFGNAESMVRWVRQPDGTWSYDFSVLDRYLDTALKHHHPDRILVVGLVVWFRQLNTENNALVTVLDPKTGRTELMPLPAYGTAECETLLRPLIAAVRQRLEKRGLADRVLFGMADDVWPDPAHVAMFNRILPRTPWFIASHGGGTTLPADPRERAKSVRFGCQAMVYGSPIPDPREKRLYGWQRTPAEVSLRYNRENTANLPLSGFPEPWAFHMWMESTLTAGLNGNGHVGGDYFPFARGQSIFSRYPTANVMNLGLVGTTPDLLAPGPEGPAATVRSENARLGIQEAEARVFIEKALVNKARPLPAELAKPCQQLLDQRQAVMRMWTLNSLLWHWRRGTAEIGAVEWQKSNRRLFEAAAQVDDARK